MPYGPIFPKVYVIPIKNKENYEFIYNLSLGD